MNVAATTSTASFQSDALNSTPDDPNTIPSLNRQRSISADHLGPVFDTNSLNRKLAERNVGSVPSVTSRGSQRHRKFSGTHSYQYISPAQGSMCKL